MTEYLCARPHVKTLDFSTARFVVACDAGIRVGTAEGMRHLEIGEEVPAGILDEVALRQLYEYPVPHPIETVEYAMTVPHLREACARKGTVVVREYSREDVEPFADDEEVEAPLANDEEVEAPLAVASELDRLSKKQLSDLCYRKGLRIDGTKQALRNRLAAVLG